MGFFDLNIPFPESSATTPSLETKAVRVKLATAAMELGYSGVAYNREMKGVMSDRDRCTITPLTLASLLRLSPSLASSVHFHRDRLGVPLAAPFRQYTRLTVSVDSLVQALALNSGNPVLKTYDIVAVRPLNQTVFDHACEKSEVDIIAIDFSEKLPFRLKPPMVKAAIQRGVYFEIRYSGLIANIQSRRQIIANAKLLVDWTRGKNLIISSAASTVYDLRGPYDVANLSSLLGLSMERAKAALSKNCRALITKALRKKHFHKEAVKVELIASGEKVDFDKPWPSDLLKWDPLSSGGGDLMLEDLAKSFAAADKASKNVKSIDFTSIFDRDAMPGNKVVSKSQTPDDGKNANLFSKLASLTDGLDLPETTLHSLRESPFKHQAFEDQNSQVLYNCETTKTMSSIVGIGAPIIIKEQDEGNNNSTESHDKRLTELSSDTVLDTVHGVDSKEGDLPLPFEEDSRTGVTAQEAPRDDPMDSNSAGVVIKDWEKSLPLIDNSQSSTEIEQLQELIYDLMDSDSADVVIKDREKSLLLIDNSESPTENEQLQELKDVPLLADVPIQESNHLSGAKDKPQCAATKDQEHERAFYVNSSQGKSNVKKRKHRQQGLVFPLKLKMNPSSFKKPRKSKNKTKKA